MTKDDLAKSYGFDVVDSNLEYYKKFVGNVDLMVYDISWSDMEWQVKLMEHYGGLYVAMKEIGRFETFEKALDKAKTLEPDGLISLLGTRDNDEYDWMFEE